MVELGEQAPAGTPNARAAAVAWILGALVLAVALRTVEARRKSLWLDELHTLHVAAGDSLSGVVERVRPDFHAPLFFFAAHAARSAPAHTQRWLAAGVGLLTILPLLGLAAYARLSAGATAIVALAFAALPFQVQYGAELRPYAWMQLCCAAIAWAALTDQGSARARFFILAGAVAIGLNTHYLTAVAVLAIGAVRLVARCVGALSLKEVVLAGVLGVAGFLPWVLIDESWILTDPGVMLRDETSAAPEPGPAAPPASAPAISERRHAAADLASAVPRMIAPMGAALGSVAGGIVRAATAVLCLVATMGAGLALVRRLRTGRARDSGGILPAVAVAVLIATMTGAACAWLWNRAPIQYFAGAAWAWPLALGAAVGAFPAGRPRRIAIGITGAAIIVAGLGHVAGRPRENIARGVAAALAKAHEKDAVVTAILRQPAHYSHLLPFTVFAPGAAALDPRDIPPATTAGARRVVVLARTSAPDDPRAARDLWDPLLAGRKVGETLRIDDAISVYVLE
jgi:hypothetical protein